MALNGTPFHHEVLEIQAGGLGEVVSHKSVNWGYARAGEVVKDRRGRPRGVIKGSYDGTASIELATQEGLELVAALAEQNGDELTATLTYAPREGDTRTLELQLWHNKGDNVDEPDSESMLTLEFLHTDYARLDGNTIYPEE